MPKVICVHEYQLKPGVKPRDFEVAIQTAEERGLLRLPGMLEYHFLKGIKGHRGGLYATIWVYESRAAWERLWGPPESPLQKKDYPERWRVWEKEILAPFLAQDPDQITFTDYQELRP